MCAIQLRPKRNRDLARAGQNASMRLSTHEYESLSREERLRRIGALLCKAATLALEQERREAEETNGTPALPGHAPSSGGTVDAAVALLPEELALLRRFVHLGELTMREAMRFWETSRTTAYRRLTRLIQAEWIERFGATNATRFRFTGKARRAVQPLEPTLQTKPQREQAGGAALPASP